jgi:hypothetical protein
MFQKIFYRWRMSVERSISEEKERRWVVERRVVRDQLKKLKFSCLEANLKEEGYLKAALSRGEDVMSGIDRISRDILADRLFSTSLKEYPS